MIGPPLIFLEHGALPNIEAKKCFPPSNRSLFCPADGHEDWDFFGNVCHDASLSKSFVRIYSPLVLHSFKYPFVVLELFGL